MNLQTQTDSSAAGQALRLPPPDGNLIGANHPRRMDVENFIARRFLEAHGARVNRFMPHLLAVFDDRGRVLAAAGIRNAGLEPLFLEYYLEMPVEQAIAERTGNLQVRHGIVEIGNLASRSRRASRTLFLILARHLYRERFDWAVFTGCSSLHRMFAALGIPTVGLGRALQAKLPRDQQTWGSYYEDDPQVVAGRVNCGRAVFERIETAA